MTTTARNTTGQKQKGRKAQPSKTATKPRDEATEKVLLTTQLSDVVALNFRIDPRVLRRRVPKGLELRTFEGDAYVSLVAMVLRKVKVWGFPVSVAGGFGELNLRYYVRRKDGDGYQNGACFLKDYISSASAAWILSSVFKTDFDRLKMKRENTGFNSKDDGAIPKVDYRWTVGENSNRIRIKARKKLGDISPNSKVGFILDNNNEYSRRDGKTYEYRVQHPKWTIWDAAQANFTCDVEKLFGKEFVKPLSRRPVSVFVSSGSNVTIHRPTVVG